MVQSLEDIILEQSKRLEELTKATSLIQNKEHLSAGLIAAQTDAASLKKELEMARINLQRIKEQYEAMRMMPKLLESLEERIKHQTDNIPLKLLQDYAMSGNNNGENLAELNSTTAKSNTRTASSFAGDLSVEDEGNRVDNCKKTLFDEPRGFRPIELLEREEFSRIPKYMIGRQTLEAVNQFVATINQILKAKYSLIALGKNGARKKGEFDLYMTYIKQESADSKEKGQVYFFTAEDYYRHTKTKLDKSKLNLLVVLRHCARLREVRSAKAIQYTAVTLV